MNGQVYEIGTWVMDDQVDDILHGVISVSAAGVVVKVSQGANYARPNVRSLLGETGAHHVLCGVVHYLEPWAGDPDEEAANLLATITDAPLALGIWLELDDLGGKPLFEVNSWLTELVAMIHTPQRPVVLMFDVSLLDQGLTVPTGVRSVYVDRDADTLATPWAVYQGTEKIQGVGVPVYQLTSTRGLNPPVPQAPAERPAEPDVARIDRAIEEDESVADELDREMGSGDRGSILGDELNSDGL